MSLVVNNLYNDKKNIFSHPVRMANAELSKFIWTAGIIAP